MKRILIASVIAIALLTLTLRFLGNTTNETAAEKVQAEWTARFKSLRLLASQGRTNAQYALAMLYLEGKGTAKNPKKAFVLLNKIARKGHLRAQYELGQLYEKGEGVAKNYFKALEWYTLASNLGNPDAQFALAELYFNGRGIPRNYADALTLYIKSASQGNAAAQYLVGTIYQDGWGVKSDYAEAYKWYSLALAKAVRVIAVNPSYDPAKALERLKLKMKKFQIEQGKRRLEKWRRSH